MATLNRSRMLALVEDERTRFVQARPASRALRERAAAVMPDGVPNPWMAGLYRHPALYVKSGSGARFQDVDGHVYLDFNLADLSGCLGYGPNAVTAALADRAGHGLQFLLPCDNAVALSELLAERTALPFWHHTLSATGAVAEVIRIARASTGRSRVLIFKGGYHGHDDVTLSDARGIPEAKGVSGKATKDTRAVAFNDLPAAERVLAGGTFALALIEPALSNCGLVLPKAGYLAELAALARRHGALFALDEAHSFQFAYGGLKRAWALDADFLILGKGLGSGLAWGAYGMTEEIAAFVENCRDVDVAAPRGVALGGTLHGNALSMAGVRAALEHALTENAQKRVDALGARLADGIAALIARFDLPWVAHRLGPRSGFHLTPRHPVDADDAWIGLDTPFADARRIFMANRGVWDAIATAGPQAGHAHEEADIERYLEVAGEFLEEVVDA